MVIFSTDMIDFSTILHIGQNIEIQIKQKTALGAVFCTSKT